MKQNLQDREAQTKQQHIYIRCEHGGMTTRPIKSGHLLMLVTSVGYYRLHACFTVSGHVIVHVHMLHLRTACCNITNGNSPQCTLNGRLSCCRILTIRTRHGMQVKLKCSNSAVFAVLLRMDPKYPDQSSYYLLNGCSLDLKFP